MCDGVARHPVPGVLLAADDDPQLVGGVLDQPHHLHTNIDIIFTNSLFVDLDFYEEDDF